MTPDQPLLSTREVATRYGVNRATVARWVKRGQLAAIVLPSGLLRFREGDVEALLTPTVRAAGDDDTAVSA